MLSLTGNLELRNGNTKLEPRTSADIDFGAQIGAIGPAAQFTSVGHAFGPSYPQKVQVSLAAARPVSTTINVQSMSNDLTLVNGGTGGETVQVTVPANTASVVVPMTGLARDASVTLKAWTTDPATFVTTTVRVLDYATDTPQLTGLSPASLTLGKSATASLSITTDIPAGPSGVSGQVSSANASQYSTAFPLTITVPADATSGTASLTSASNASGTDTLSLNGTAFTTNVTFQAVPPCSPQIVMSAVYGGGGGSGTWRCDYIELHNRSSQPASLNGLVIQYAAAGGTSITATNGKEPLPNVTVPGGGYFLASADCAGTATTNTVAADYSPFGGSNGYIAIAQGGGKVFLTTTSTPITLDSSGCVTTTSTPSVLDWIGFGSSTNCGEGTKLATTFTNSLVAERNDACVDTNSNSSDFTAVSATTTAARNSSTPVNVCSSVCGP
ncbi:MAG: lamin tail domain-containing protein [Deltaproteobacteria bacterium]|nr:lamin tail domain-containing protein [Deltaproteobacteria bacterium]